MKLQLVLVTLSFSLEASLANYRYGGRKNPAICQALVDGVDTTNACPVTHDCLPPEQGPPFLDLARAVRPPPGVKPIRFCIPKRCTNDTNPEGECGGNGAKCKHVERSPTDGSVVNQGWCKPGCEQKMMMRADMVFDENQNKLWTRFREDTLCKNLNGTRTAITLPGANAGTPLYLTYCNKPGKYRTEQYIRATSCRKQFCKTVKQQLSAGTVLSAEDTELEKCQCKQRCHLPRELRRLGCRLRKQPDGAAICKGRCLKICPSDIINYVLNSGININNTALANNIPNLWNSIISWYSIIAPADNAEPAAPIDNAEPAAPVDNTEPGTTAVPAAPIEIN